MSAISTARPARFSCSAIDAARRSTRLKPPTRQGCACCCRSRTISCPASERASPRGWGARPIRRTCNASLRRCALPMRRAPISIGSPPCSTGSRRPQLLMPCRDCASNSPSLPTACHKAWRRWHRMQPRAWATFATLPDRWLPSAPPTTDCWRSRPNSCRNGRLSPRSRQLYRRSASICASRFRSSTRAPSARRPAPRRCRRRRSTPAGCGSS